MALIKCVDCGKDHSDQAPSCPSCGRPNQVAQGSETKTGPIGTKLATTLNKTWQSRRGRLGLCAFGAVAATAALIKVVLPSDSYNASTKAVPGKTSLSDLAATKPPRGWAEMETPGIYFNICSSSKPTPDCEAARSRLIDASGLVVRFWCKEVACGDIYVEANQITDSGASIGWTNDSAHGEKGDVVYLALQATAHGNGPEDFVFGYPAITKVVIDNFNVKGFPLGVGRP